MELNIERLQSKLKEKEDELREIKGSHRESQGRLAESEIHSAAMKVIKLRLQSKVNDGNREKTRLQADLEKLQRNLNEFPNSRTGESVACRLPKVAEDHQGVFLAYHHHVVGRVVRVQRAVVRRRWRGGDFDRICVRELLDQRGLPGLGQAEQRDALLHLLAHRAKDGAAAAPLHHLGFLRDTS